MWQNDQTCTSSNGSSSEEAISNNNFLIYSHPISPPPPPPPPPHILLAHHQCVATITAQNPYTSSLALAGKFLFAGSSDREIQLWKLDHLINPSSNHENPSHHHNNNHDMVISGKGAVKAIVVTPDHHKLVTAHQDHKIRVWKIDRENEKIEHSATLPTLVDRATKLLIPKNHIKVRRHKKLTWVHHADAISSLALSADGSLLYSVSWDRSVKIWRTGDFKCMESISDAHDDAINAVAVSSDGCVYTGSSDKKIKVWRKKQPNDKTHSLVDTLEKHNSGINALALSTDGAVLYSGASDRSILVWMNNEEGGGMGAVGAMRGHKKSVLCLAIASDLVCSGSADKTVRIWRGVGRSYSYSCLAVLDGHKGPVKCITVGFDECGSNPTDAGLSYLLCSASLDCVIKVWRIMS